LPKLIDFRSSITATNLSNHGKLHVPTKQFDALEMYLNQSFDEGVLPVAASFIMQTCKGEEFGLSHEFAAMQFMVSLEFREDRKLVNMIR